MNTDETTYTVTHAARSIQSLPDGSPIPRPLAHTLLVLATYYPQVWPGQHRIAADLKVSRSSVNRYLRTLEGVNLIGRTRRGQGSTLYWLNLGLIRKCSRKPGLSVTHMTQEEQINVNDQTEDWSW